MDDDGKPAGVFVASGVLVRTGNIIGDAVKEQCGVGWGAGQRQGFDIIIHGRVGIGVVGKRHT